MNYHKNKIYNMNNNNNTKQYKNNNNNNNQKKIKIKINKNNKMKIILSFPNRIKKTVHNQGQNRQNFKLIKKVQSQAEIRNVRYV